jgi:phage terminase Nu1 subunit (DNA packaging protein)
MAKSKEPAKFEVLAIDDVAAMLMVSDRTIRNWLKDKDMPSISDERGRRFNWSQVLPWYVKMRAEEGGSERKPEAPTTWEDIERPQQPAETFGQALCRKTIAEADLKELDLATRRGEVVAIADAARAMQDTAKNLQIEILGWPTLMIGQIFGQRDRNRLFDILTRSARDLCTRLAGVQTSAPQPKPAEPSDG